MIQKKTKLLSIDISGPLNVTCIQVYKKGFNKNVGFSLDKILVTVQTWRKATERFLMKKKKINSVLVLRKQFRRKLNYGYITGVKKEISRKNGHYIKFRFNGVIVVDQWKGFKVSRYKYPVDSNLKKLEHSLFMRRMGWKYFL